MSDTIGPQALVVVTQQDPAGGPNRIYIRHAPDRILLARTLLESLDGRLADVIDDVLTIHATNGPCRYRLLPPVDADPVEAERLR